MKQPQSNIDRLTHLYLKHTGVHPTNVTPLAGGGSNRAYYRLSGPYSLIGVSGISERENKAFIYLSKHLECNGLPVPRVVAASDDGMMYLQQDLGDTSLFNHITNGENPIGLLKSTIRLLPDFQFLGSRNMDWSMCYPYADFDRRAIMWDLNYFKYCFLKPSGVNFSESSLENEFEKLSMALLECSSDTLMYRDFQSRNVMIHDGKPWLIDFQGARKGPIFYDLASFLWQARAGFSDSIREELINEYLKSLSRYQNNIGSDEFKAKLKLFVLFRLLQVLGTYGFRGNFEHKQHFLQSVPKAIINLKRLLDNDFHEYGYLRSILCEMCDNPRFKGRDKHDGLLVTVTSFSYKNGIPEDLSGNGGGFVFDCRAIDNPGRHEMYRTLTGLDAPVKEYLERNGEIADFLSNVYRLVDSSIKNYLERGFTNLMVNFGCTGGQHRSVYSAQHLAEHISKSHTGIRTRLIHRELGIESEL